jgi:hypothetical protein
VSLSQEQLTDKSSKSVDIHASQDELHSICIRNVAKLMKIEKRNKLQKRNVFLR